jgi:opacity protein-like surface antigen
MKRLLFFFVTLALLASNVYSTEWKAGGGIRAGLFSYNEDHLDTLKLSWGGQGKVLFPKYFGAEFSVQKREDTISTRFGTTIDLDTYPIHLSVLFYPVTQRVVSPYLIAGFGWYKLNATAEIDIGVITIRESISLSESAPHIGAGVEVFVGDHFSAGLDVRKLFFEFETPFGDLTADVLKYAYLVNIVANFYF